MLELRPLMSAEDFGEAFTPNYSSRNSVCVHSWKVDPIHLHAGHDPAPSPEPHTEHCDETDSFLGFSGQAHEAMAFYAKALGGQVTSEMKYRDMPPSDGSPGCNEMPPETLDHVAHSQLEIGNAIVMAADGPGGGEGSSTTINVDVDSVEEAERVFAALAEGGQVQMPIAETFWAHRWGMLIDRYGKPWMVNCMKQP